jgi:aerobic-type carbon monoxide dehydrogenase small subunit (CoxS/CutS family)
MSLDPFLRNNPDPGEAEIREALAGNICRCTGYEAMVEAVRSAANAMREA